MASLDNEWFKLTSRITQIEAELPKHKVHSRRRSALMRDLFVARTKRLCVELKMEKRIKRTKVLEGKVFQ